MLDDESIDLDEIEIEVLNAIIKDLKLDKLSGVPMHMLRYDPIDNYSKCGDEDEE